MTREQDAIEDDLRFDPCSAVREGERARRCARDTGARDQAAQHLRVALVYRIEFKSRRGYYVFAWMCLMIVGYVSAAIAITVATTMVVFAHEVLRARQAREDFMLQPPA